MRVRAYALIEQAFDPVKASWEERFERSYGHWRGCLDGLVYEFLDCGDLERGFARVVCDDSCKNEYLVALYCSRRKLFLDTLN